MLLADNVILDHLAKVVFASFLHCKVSPLFFHTLLFGNKSLSAAHMQGGWVEEIKFHLPVGEYLHKLFGTLL